MAPEVLHIAFTLLGMGLGWYIKHQSIGIPQDILEALQKLFASKQQQDGHTLLKDLLGSLPPASTLPRS